MSEYKGDILETQGVQTIKCLACVSEHLAARQKMPDQDPPVIQDAITWAPSWQTKTMGGNVMMACVAVPSCLDHLSNEEKSPQQRAMEGGILLGGSG